MHLSDNRLERLPASVAKLLSLQVLTLHTNRLRSLPLEMSAEMGGPQLALARLDLFQNPLHEELPALMVREVLQEMRRKRSLQRCREELALMLGQEA